MSMLGDAVNDYGLVLDTDILHEIASKLCEDYTDEAWEEDKDSFVEDVVDTLGLECVSMFSGDALKIDDDGSDDWNDSEYYNGDSIYYKTIRAYPTLFSAPYKDMGEVVAEFKSRLGEYLPENFNYREAIRHIVGAYLG